MNADKFEKMLKKLNACQDACDWARGMTLQEAFEKMNRADWALWLLAKSKWITHKQLVSLACDCAETALKYIPSGEDRPRKAIETTRVWIRGEATIGDVRSAAYAANDATYAANAAAYAADTADAAAYAADAAYAAADAAAYAANDATYAANAATYAADAAYAAAYARKQAHEEMCDIIRSKTVCKANKVVMKELEK